MAQDYSSAALSTPQKFTSNATANKLDVITPPKGALYFDVYFVDAQGLFYEGGADAATINTDALPIPANEWYRVQLGASTVSLASTGTSVTVHLRFGRVGQL